MPILIDRSSRIICFGMMQEAGYFQIQQGLAYGTQIVALVEARNKGREVLSLPVFETAREARKQTNGDVALIMSPPEKAPDAILEANEAGIGLIVCVTKDIASHDVVEVVRILRRNKRSRLLGPGSCGIISPEQARCGLMPAYIWTKGSVGIVSTTDTLAYEAAALLSASGIGQSSFVGVGHEAVCGTSCAEVLDLFEKDQRTELIVMIGTPQGRAEADVGQRLLRTKAKPLVALIAGKNIPRDWLLYHCGENFIEAEEKIARLREGGAIIVENLTALASVVQRVLAAKELHENH